MSIIVGGWFDGLGVGVGVGLGIGVRVGVGAGLLAGKTVMLTLPVSLFAP